jgi:hypothetical protein
MPQLSDLYDADRRKTWANVERLASVTHIPHPLTGIDYADGSIPDQTAGHIRCVGCRIGRPCKEKRKR